MKACIATFENDQMMRSIESAVQWMFQLRCSNSREVVFMFRVLSQVSLKCSCKISGRTHQSH
jgi:hypothetical protein